MKVTQPSIEGLKSSLPTRISGIVFWGTVFIGLLIALVVLENKRDELEKHQTANTGVLHAVIKKSFDYSRTPGLTENTRVELGNNLKPFVDILQSAAIVVTYQDSQFIYGEPGEGHDVINKTLDITPVFPDIAPYTINASIYVDSIDSTLSSYRKVILLTIGSLMMLFGLVLQFVLKHLLTKPFAAMIDSAQQYADGDTSIRFNETSTDEFGFLAQFINRALDNDAYHFEQMSIALNRAMDTENALLNQKERVEVTLNSLSEAVITTDVEGNIDYMNPVAESLVGCASNDAKYKKLTDVIKLVSITSHAPLASPIEQCIRGETIIDLGDSAAIKLGDESIIAIEASVAPMRNNSGDIVGTVMVCLDVTHTHELALQLSHQVNHDMLTNLYNRHAFEHYLGKLINDLSDHTHHVLLYLDLDQFKIVNDTCGHSAGDELLRQLADILEGCIGREDFLARLGGDEFGILLIDKGISDALAIAENIRHSIKEFRFHWLESIFEVGVSIGVVEINSENRNPTVLMSCADLACYAAKDGGRNRVHVYKQTDDDLVKRHGEMHWTTLITQAMQENRFVLYSQPITPVKTEAIPLKHWEVLIRMRLDDGSIITPIQFLSAAERYNMMAKIDRWVIAQTFRSISRGAFKVAANEKRLVSINLSGATLSDDSICQFIQEAGIEHNINFHDICFEVTETVAISNLTKASHLIKELKGCGCQFSLDDFGSGLSSFGYLKNLSVDFVKIDGSFVKDMSNDQIDHAMVMAITQIGHVMNIKTIAEWVEDETTLNKLRKIGVDYVQGYYLGEPAPIQC